MKYGFWVNLIFLLLHFGIQAQTTITGTVKDSLNAPIPYATVYLSKTSFGVLANDKGVYSLIIPQTGTFELIASCIGYKSHSQIIRAEGVIKSITIKLSERVVFLKEVTVKDKDRNRRQNYKQFINCFIGISPNSPYCTILNPKDLIVYRESVGSNLIAYSVKPLTITNSSLGYTIIYDLKNFCYNLENENLRYSGDYYFQDISNQKGKNSRTKRNRLIAYYGSRMHFLRALFTDSVRHENFEMCNIELDSCGTKILTNSLNENELRLTLNPESMTLDFSNPIFISYSDNHPELWPLPNIYRPGTYNSRIVFSDSLNVYKNGYYPDCFTISWSGDMTIGRVAELLPYDFVPKPIANAGFSLLK